MQLNATGKDLYRQHPQQQQQQQQHLVDNFRQQTLVFGERKVSATESGGGNKRGEAAAAADMDVTTPPATDSKHEKREVKRVDRSTVSAPGRFYMLATRGAGTTAAAAATATAAAASNKAKHPWSQRILYSHRSVVLRPPIPVVDSQGSNEIQPAFVDDDKYLVKVSHDSEFAREDYIRNHILERLGHAVALKYFSFWIRPLDAYGGSFHIAPTVARELCPDVCALFPRQELNVRLTKFLGYSLAQLYHNKGLRMTAHFAMAMLVRICDIIEVLSSEGVRVQQGDLNAYNIIVEVSKLDEAHKCLHSPASVATVRVIDFGRAFLLNRDPLVGSGAADIPSLLRLTAPPDPSEADSGGGNGGNKSNEVRRKPDRRSQQRRARRACDLHEWIFDRQPMFEEQAGYMPPEMYCSVYSRKVIERLWPRLSAAGAVTAGSTTTSAAASAALVVDGTEGSRQQPPPGAGEGAWLADWLPSMIDGSGYRRLYALSQMYMDRTMLYMFAYNMLLEDFLSKFVVHTERAWFAEHIVPILRACVASLDPAGRPSLDAVRAEICRVQVEAHNPERSQVLLPTSFGFGKHFGHDWSRSAASGVVVPLLSTAPAPSTLRVSGRVSKFASNGHIHWEAGQVDGDDGGYYKGQVASKRGLDHLQQADKVDAADDQDCSLTDYNEDDMARFLHCHEVMDDEDGDADMLAAV